MNIARPKLPAGITSVCAFVPRMTGRSRGRVAPAAADVPHSLAYQAPRSLLPQRMPPARAAGAIGLLWRKHGNATHQGSERRGADVLGRRRGDRAARRFL